MIDPIGCGRGADSGLHSAVYVRGYETSVIDPMGCRWGADSGLQCMRVRVGGVSTVECIII